jgi:hypothetical protein
MAYITYSEYIEMGGTCELTAFNRVADRISGMVANATFNRVDRMAETPRQVKALCRDLVELMAKNVTVDKDIASWSESAGVISQSVSYVTKTADEQQAEIDALIADYLGGVCDDNGTPLLYRGASR